jgi:uncharacterized protein YggE
MDRRRRWIPLGAAIGVIALLGGMILALGMPSRGSAASPAAQPAQATGSRMLTAQGQGEVRVQPDQATMTLGVESRAAEARTALAANAEKLNGVIAALKGQGLASNSMQTSNLSLYFDAERKEQVALHNLTVRLDDVQKVGSMLDVAVAAGANTSWGVSFGLKDASSARSQALKAAIADTRQRADDMAAALGMRITGVVAAEEASAAVGPQGAVPGVGAGGGVAPVQPGELSIAASVRVTYTFGE